MKISKRTREQAALVCAMAASTTCIAGVLEGMRLIRDRYFRFRSRAYLRDPVCKLVSSAFERAYQSECTKLPGGSQDWTAQMAEAEAMLRTGWTP